MPKNHARKKALANLKVELGIKHADAISLLDHPNDNERETLAEYLETYVDINTYKEAVDYLRREQNDPRNQIMCRDCGWTYGMVCPECAKGCGCEYECTGWRHEEMRAATGDYDEDDDPNACPECGAGGGGDPYGECCCYEDEEDQAA
ncbi:hypothetical protein ACFRCX_30525 [Streptomyces sp. NPDC056652]|uniref:hypothetical protein n=1 Tax=Streptomyces sp. NPDC056652 TaxID=3345893 RepID=UPI0036BA8D75